MIIYNKNNENCLETDYDYCKFDYPLDEFQKHALSSIKKDRNVLVCAATGNGKTSVAVGAIALSYLENKRVIYTAPIKALLNQKYSEFRKAFDDVGIETGDVKINPNGQCVVMTTEVLRNKLLLNDIEVLKDVKCVIFDEVHYIKDPSRGNVWETCISMLHVQQVMLSATIKNPELFAQWIQEVQSSRDLHLIEVTERKVPLDYYWYTDNNLIHIMDNDKNFENFNYENNVLNINVPFKNDLRKLNETIHLLKQKDLFPATFFVMSKKNCEHYATKVTIPLIDAEQSSNAVNEFNFLLQRDQELEKQSLQVDLLRKLVSKGIGMHHAGLNPLLKEIIEILYSKGYLQVLFATGTFTVGLNMPIRTVVLTGLDVYSEQHGRIMPFSSDEFIQMCGRAGRRGLDKRGYVVVCLLRNIKPPSLHELKNMMTNQPDTISSKLHVDTNVVIDLLNNGKNVEEIIDFFAKSMHGRELRSEISALEMVVSDGAPEFNCSEDFKEYIELQNKMSKSLRQNQLKKVKNSIETLLKDKKINEEVKKYEKFLLEKNAYEGAKSSLENLKQCDQELVTCCLKELEQQGYIADNALLLKGNIASCINGYDKIVLTELLTSSWICDFNVCELGVLLAFFIKFSGDVELYEIEHISYLYDLLVSMDATVYTSFAPLVYQWLDGIAYGSIEGINSSSEGNFITQMNLLVQLVDNLISVCEAYEFHVLMKKLSELRILLRRDIVITQSLHL